MLSNISVEKAASLMDKAPMFVRLALREQRLDIGVAVQGKNRWSYHISPGRFAAYMGMTMEQLEEAVNG